MATQGGRVGGMMRRCKEANREAVFSLILSFIIVKA